MSVSNGQLANQDTFNNAYISRKIDSDTIGVVGLKNIANPDSGAFVTNIQRLLNELANASGVLGEGDATRNDYSSNNFISNGDNRKVAIGKIDAELLVLSDLIADGSIKFKSYISDNAYEIANGLPTGGESYYNTTTGKIRYYDGIELDWKVIGDQVVGIQENLGIGNDVNTDFVVSNAPLNAEALLVYLNGNLCDKSEYSLSLPTISFVTAPSIGQTVYVSYLSNGTPASPVVSVGNNNVQYITVSALDITNKFVALPSAPSEPTKVLVDIISGSTQQYGFDFNVIGSNLNWSGFNLDGIISSGDVIRVQFFN